MCVYVCVIDYIGCMLLALQPNLLLKYKTKLTYQYEPLDRYCILVWSVWFKSCPVMEGVIWRSWLNWILRVTICLLYTITYHELQDGNVSHCHDGYHIYMNLHQTFQSQGSKGVPWWYQGSHCAPHTDCLCPGFWTPQYKMQADLYRIVDHLHKVHRFCTNKMCDARNLGIPILHFDHGLLRGVHLSKNNKCIL